MPNYCFEAKNGEVVHRIFRMKECPRSITVDGRAFNKNIVCIHSDARPAIGKAKWPICSESAAVHPSQIAEAIEFNKQRGCPTDFDRHGRPEWRDAGHKKRFLRVNRFFEKGPG